MNRFATVISPLGDQLLLAKMSGRDALCTPFEFVVELLSLDTQLSLADFLGQAMTVQLEVIGEAIRHFHGLVTRFARTGDSGRYAVYTATLRPWSWLLTQSVDCRIYQDMTVPQVIEEVFRRHGFSDFETGGLSGSYRTWDYMVQYRESAHAFVTRLMEQEGIYYYFKHEQHKHTLVLADSYSAHSAEPGFADIPFFPPTTSAQNRKRDHIDTWQFARELRPGAYALSDFNFTKPKAAMDGYQSAAQNAGTFEIFDYPGEYNEPDHAAMYTRLRLEQLSAGCEVAKAQGNARGLAVGRLFNLHDFAHEDCNREYLIIGASYYLDLGLHESGDLGHESSFRCQLSVIASQTPFRPAQVTPKPIIPGPQTATVVGPAGEEIWTDEYGRVKLQFHWDRVGRRNENSSCWVRVAQIWAGARFGAMHIPRIGQEVIVEFLEGDPDRPIVTGRVYNADNMPPYELRQHKTQSGIKSRSTLGGHRDNFNELRFEDKKGDEEVFIHAEKDLREVAKNNHHTRVGAHQTNDVAKNHSERVGENQELAVAGNRMVAVAGSQNVVIAGATAAEGIHGYRIVVKDDYELHASQSVTVTAPTSIKLACGKSVIELTPTDIIITAGGAAQLTLNSEVLLKAAANALLQLNAKSLLSAADGGTLSLTANAVLEGVETTISGQMSAQTISGASSVKADAAGVTVLGVPCVQVN